MYYARVLVGEYMNGNADLLVAPNKGTGNRYEKYDSVVNDINDIYAKKKVILMSSCMY